MNNSPDFTLHVVENSIKIRSFRFEIATLVSIKLAYIIFQAFLGSYLYPRRQKHLKEAQEQNLFRPQ